MGKKKYELFTCVAMTERITTEKKKKESLTTNLANNEAQCEKR